MKNVLSKSFVVFEVIFSFVITNIVVFVGSILSATLLLPVFLVSMSNYIRNFYIHKEYSGIIFTFFTGIKGKIKVSIKILYPLMLFIGLLMLSIYYYNGFMSNYFGQTFIVVVFIVQLFVLYQSVGVLLLSALQVAIDSKRNLVETYKYSFLMLNAFPVRSFLAMLSFITVIVLAVLSANALLFALLPLALMAFYIVFSDVFEKHIQKVFIK